MSNFLHGGDIYSFAKELNVKLAEIIDFSSNINFIKPSVKFDNIDISAYPDHRYTLLKQALSVYYNVEPDMIQLFNGSTDAIFHILHHYDKLTLYAPLYVEYKKAKNFKVINRFENIYDNPQKDSLVVFVNPSTPDGRYYELDNLFDIWIKNNNTVLIDESFLDFCGKKSATQYLNIFDKLIILKSFSKFYACAGVRVGIVISKIKFETPIWNISAFDEHYILQALKNKTFPYKTRKIVKENKHMLYNILQNSGLFDKIYDSCTNFYLAKLKNMTAQDLQKKLSKYKILIRDCSNFDFLDHYHVRFAVKSKRDLEYLQKALKWKIYW